MRHNRKVALEILLQLIKTKRIRLKDISGEYRYLWTIDDIERILNENDLSNQL